MKLKEEATITGRLHIVLRDAFGRIKDEETICNLVVTVGKGFIASRMKDATVAAMSHIAVGSDSTAPVVGDTTLGAELGRVALTTTTVAGNQISYVATFPAGTGTGALQEAGIFNDPAAGIMLNRAVYSLKNKEAGDSMTITWVLTVN